jgi:hypothetical protein
MDSTRLLGVSATDAATPKALSYARWPAAVKGRDDRSDSRPEMPLVFTALVRRFGSEMRFADLQRDWDAEAGRGGRRGRGGRGQPRG